jgi:hypothetical protein
MTTKICTIEKSKEQIDRDHKEGLKMRFRVDRERKYGWRSWFEPLGYNGNFTIRNELYLFKKDFSVQLTLRDDCEGTISFNLCIPFLFSWYFSLDAKFGYSDWWKKLLRLDSFMRQGRKWGIRWHSAYGCVDGGSLDILLGSYENESRSTDPKWLSLCFYPKTILCGKTEYEEYESDNITKKVMIKGDKSYPDKEYDLYCSVRECRWSWKRFLKPLLMTRTTVEVINGGQVPHPGKGTTCYNYGESGLSSQSSAESDPDKAIEKFVEQVYWYRKNYPL